MSIFKASAAIVLGSLFLVACASTSSSSVQVADSAEATTAEQARLDRADRQFERAQRDRIYPQGID
ncbi:MAG: hypothetical protein CMK07_08520 [Ponticaulis sp.]|nr:hypothetical protein [Ponticaulis sp.]